MRQVLGIFGLLVAICVFNAIAGENFLSAFNIENVIRRSALFGIISIGAAIVIIGRGIDLSIGSVVCLVGILTPWLLVHHEVPVWIVLPGVQQPPAFHLFRLRPQGCTNTVHKRA